MTFDAWRSAVGGQWQRLFIYPGGLAALALVALGWGLWRLLVGAAPWPPASGNDRESNHLWGLLGLAGPCVVLALLPAPAAAELRSPLDLPAAWLLLDMPLLIALAVGWPAAAAPQADGPRRAAVGLLVAAPLLALLLAAWGAATRSWTISSLVQSSPPAWFRWAFLAVWLVALVPGLALGPWHAPAGRRSVALGLTLRRLGHLALLALAALPLWPAPASADQGWWALARRDGRLPTLLALAAAWLALLIAHRLGRGRSPVIWGRVAWGGGLLGLIGLVALAFQGWPG